MRLIRKSFQTVSPASAEQGDFERSGWIHEIGYPIEPDDYDTEEFGTESVAAIALAAKFIGNNGNVKASSSRFSGWNDDKGNFVSHIWYTSIDASIDYSNGESTTYSYFLDGFSDAEQRAIFDKLR